MTVGDKLIRWAAATATAVVAVIAAVISYQHAYALVVAHGETGATARALPLTVDGLIVTCSLVLLDAARRRTRAPLLAWVLLACGIAATVGANVAHGLDNGVVGAVIAGWPALVAVGSFEMLARLIRGGRPEVDHVRGAADMVATTEDERHPEGDSDPTDLPAGGQSLPDVDPTATGGLFALPDDPALAEVVATARDRYADLIATGRRPSIRTLRRELRIGHPRATAVRDALVSSEGSGEKT